MQIRGHDIGVCSWSVHPKDMADLVSCIQQLGLNHVQLALGGLMMLDDKRKHQELAPLRNAGIVITSGMIGFPGEDYSTIAIIRQTGGYLPDEQWPLRRKMSEEGAKFAAELGLKSITAHIGFVPPSSDPKYPVMLQRVGEVAQVFADNGLNLLMETGQERAPELLQFLNDLSRKNVQVNFDPANMILYGAGDPIEAVQTLGRHIGHVHVKDAILSSQPAVLWGTEVPFGKGQVNPTEFLNALDEAGYKGSLAIEREAGPNRMADIRIAIESLKNA
jgi:L-ribulose-5-phosphate 3-epimerase